MTSLADQLRQEAQDILRIADDVENLEEECGEPPVQPPPVEPPPVEPPPTEPPPDIPSDYLDLHRELNPDALLVFDFWLRPGQRYIREQPLVVLSEKVDLVFWTMRAGGHRRDFSIETYVLLCDGDEIARTTVGEVSGKGYKERGVFSVELDELSPGWHVFDIQGAPEETCAFWPVYILNEDDEPINDFYPVCTGSHSLGGGLHKIEWVPATYQPTVFPLERRVYEPFEQALDRTELWTEALVPMRKGDTHHPCVDDNGIESTFNKQSYKWTGMIDQNPPFVMKDGERGAGTITCPTHIEIGIANCDETGPVGNCYVLEPTRFCVVRETGKVTTICGSVHDDLPPYYRSDRSNNTRLVGDWSAVEDKGMQEAWGMCWDSETLKINEDAEKIPVRPGGPLLHPHFTNPVAYIADSMKDRVLRLEFDMQSHETEPVVTEFLTGTDMWDCVEYKPDPDALGTIIVSVRGEHQINEYAIDTGEFIRTIVQGQPLAITTPQRLIQLTAPLETVKAADTVLPEGLYIMDDWLYFGSAAQRQIKRVHLQTGEIQLLWDDVTDGKGQYHKIAISDGTFGPRGTIFVCSWAKANFGGPKIGLIDPETGMVGRGWNITRSTSKSIARGAGGDIDSMIWNTAVAVRNGRCVYGAANEGLYSLSKLQPDDPRFDQARFNAGRSIYREKYQLKHGQYGFGHFGLPLPWGEDPDLDYYLLMCTHRPPDHKEIPVKVLGH